jgi:hypothetical protein
VSGETMMEPVDRRRYAEDRTGRRVWRFIGEGKYASKLLVAMQMIGLMRWLGGVHWAGPQVH